MEEVQKMVKDLSKNPTAQYIDSLNNFELSKLKSALAICVRLQLKSSIPKQRFIHLKTYVDT